MILKNPFPRKHRRGFTLVELLVVIVIVAALAAITMVMVSKIRRQANSTKSVSNLRQFGTALLSFAAENGNRMPNIGSWTAPDDPPPNVKYPVSWDGYLFPYLGMDDEQVGKASKTYENLFVHGNDKRTNEAIYCRRTYAMFRAVGSRAAKDEGWSGNQFTPLSKVDDPSRVGLLTERPWGGGNAGTPSFADISYPSQMAKNPDSGADLNPGGKFNIVFADGHIESLFPKDTIGTGTLQDPNGLWTFTAED